MTFTPICSLATIIGARHQHGLWVVLCELIIGYALNLICMIHLCIKAGNPGNTHHALYYDLGNCKF